MLHSQGWTNLRATVSRLQDPFYLDQGSRPLYFRHARADDIDGAQEGVLWMHLVIEALSDIRPRVETFRQTIDKVLNHIKKITLEETIRGSELLASTCGNLITMLNACSQWLVDFNETNPIPRLEGLSSGGENIIRAHIANCEKCMDRETLVRLIREESQQAAPNELFEHQVRSLLCDAPDECKDVELCERLLDWRRCF